MIKLYFKEYNVRYIAILTAVIVSVIAVTIAFLVNIASLQFCAAEKANLDRSSFEVGYLLNYSSKLPNEYIFTNTDILFFKDAGRHERLPAVSAMEQSENKYTDESLLFEPQEPLLSNEARISRNVAEKYSLEIGDILYAEVPFSTNLQKITIAEIGMPDYGIESIDSFSELGVILLGYNEQYDKNVISKYIVFSSHSLSEELSVYPQIIDRSFNRNEIETAANKPLLSFALWASFAITVAFCAGWLLVLKESWKSLKVRRRKGMPPIIGRTIYILEMTACLLVPVMLSSHIFCGILRIDSIKWNILCCCIPVCAVETLVLILLPNLRRR